jgi:hypothetical protein
LPSAHVVRVESCFLMTCLLAADLADPEPQFERCWLTWDSALSLLTFEAEREWVRRAQDAWTRLRESGATVDSSTA